MSEHAAGSMGSSSSSEGLYSENSLSTMADYTQNVQQFAIFDQLVKFVHFTHKIIIVSHF